MPPWETKEFQHPSASSANQMSCVHPPAYARQRPSFMQNIVTQITATNQHKFPVNLIVATLPPAGAAIQKRQKPPKNWHKSASTTDSTSLVWSGNVTHPGPSSSTASANRLTSSMPVQSNIVGLDTQASFIPSSMHLPLPGKSLQPS